MVGTGPIGTTPAQLSSEMIESHTGEPKSCLRMVGGSVSSGKSPVADRRDDSDRSNTTGD